MCTLEFPCSLKDALPPLSLLSLGHQLLLSGACSGPALCRAFLHIHHKLTLIPADGGSGSRRLKYFFPGLRLIGWRFWTSTQVGPTGTIVLHFPLPSHLGLWELGQSPSRYRRCCHQSGPHSGPNTPHLTKPLWLACLPGVILPEQPGSLHLPAHHPSNTPSSVFLSRYLQIFASQNKPQSPCWNLCSLPSAQQLLWREVLSQSRSSPLHSC